MPQDTYRPPILASIFRGFGWLSLVGTVFVAIASFILLNQPTPHSHYNPAETNSATTYWMVFVPTASGLFSTLILFGIGQVIDHIGQCAFYTGKAFELLDRQDTLTGGRWRDMQMALDNIAAHGKRIAVNTNTTGAPPPQAAPSTSGRPAAPPAPLPIKRFYYVDLDSQVAGPVDMQQLRSLADGGAVSDDTMICAEGANEWLPLAGTVAV